MRWAAMVVAAVVVAGAIGGGVAFLVAGDDDVAEQDAQACAWIQRYEDLPPSNIDSWQPYLRKAARRARTGGNEVLANRIAALERVAERVMNDVPDPGVSDAEWQRLADKAGAALYRAEVPVLRECTRAGHRVLIEDPA